MTTEVLSHLRSQIWNLSESERAELARELIMSLDGPRDDSAEKAWNEEVVKRAFLVREGNARLLTRDEFRQTMRGRLGE